MASAIATPILPEVDRFLAQNPINLFIGDDGCLPKRVAFLRPLILAMAEALRG